MNLDLLNLFAFHLNAQSDNADCIQSMLARDFPNRSARPCTVGLRVRCEKWPLGGYRAVTHEAVGSTAVVPAS